MKNNFIKLLAIVLSALIASSIIASAVHGESSVASTKKETDPVTLYDEYCSKNEGQNINVEGHILIILDSNNEEIKKNEFREVYSECSESLNKEKVVHLKQDNIENSISAKYKYAESLDVACNLLDTTIDIKKMTMLNPLYSEGKNGAYSVQDGHNDTFLLEIGDDVNFRDALIELNNNPRIIVAEPDYCYSLTQDSNDPLYSQQWGLEAINARGAWNKTTGSSSVVVGVIDSGVDGTHPDLVDNLWINPNPNQNGYLNDTYGYDFYFDQGGVPTDDNGHGTHVAGIIGARGNNGVGVSGVNWNVSLASFRVGTYSVYLSAVILALNYCNQHNIKITNNSYGDDIYSTVFKHAIDNYQGIFVAAAGNEGVDIDANPTYPACFDCPNIISVGSVDSNMQKSSFSNYGSQSVDVFAPGGTIYSTCIEGTYTYKNGTSMATPFVTGVIALVMAVRPSYPIDRIKSLVCTNVNEISNLDGMCVSGGIIDAEKAVYFTSGNYSIVRFYSDNTFLNKQYVINGGKATVPDHPIKNNYFFTGWYQSGSTIPFDFENTVINGNLSLYAGWESADAGKIGTLFPDIGFRNKIITILNNHDNGNRNQSTILSTTDISYLSTITSLNIENLAISDLTGIEYFTCLRYLYCSQNRISFIPQGILDNLIVLDCSCNRITSLNFSNNTVITKINCRGNWLTSLSTAGLVSLKFLDCTGNSISSLNVNNNTSLEELYCSGNRITGLDVSSCVSIEKIDCATNNLSYLILGNSLTNLEELDCSHNSLRSISLNNLGSLKKCFVSENKFKRLDFSGLLVVEHIECMDNKLVDITIPSTGSLYLFTCSHNDLRSINLGSHSFMECVLTYNKMINASKVIASGTYSGYSFNPQKTWNNPFSDVLSSTDLYYDVEYVWKEGLMMGTSTSLFSPTTSLQRESFAVILYRRNGSPSVQGLSNPFVDVPDNNSESTNAIKWAYANGIIFGTSPTTFEPSGNIIRQDMAVMLTRYIDNVTNISLPVVQTFNYSGTYSDYNQVSSYAISSVKRLYEAGIMIGNGNQFNPLSNALRDQTARIMYNLYTVED